ncbi:MAG: outer membrane lipoprotein LolB [Burkholderiaceae bacterium]
MKGLRGAARRAAAVLLTSAVAGCASLPPGALDRTAQGRTIEGRLSVRYKDLETAKEESLSGKFVWTSGAGETELSLLDPFGQTVALIRSGRERSSITFRDGRQVDGATPEALTAKTLGWTVPLLGLRYWLDGKPDPGSAVARLDDGRLRQDGWTIRFIRSDDAADVETAGTPPKRIDLNYPGPPAEIEMRLVVDQRSGA